VKEKKRKEEVERDEDRWERGKEKENCNSVFLF
jgi:hypothetical protein